MSHGLKHGHPFVARVHHLKLRVLAQCVVQGADEPARDPEHSPHPALDEDSQDLLRNCPKLLLGENARELGYGRHRAGKER
jgi:hypothetical protein